MNHICPICHKTLQLEQEGDSWNIYCGVWSCPSIIANIGATGFTVEEAFERLVENLNNEIDYAEKLVHSAFENDHEKS